MEYAKEFMAPHLIDDINKEALVSYTARSCVTTKYIVVIFILLKENMYQF